MNDIKAHDNLAINLATSFISVQVGGISDTFQNPLNARSDISASMYGLDETPPSLRNFSINLNSEILTLTFDETIQISTFDFSKLTLLNSINGSITYSLQSSNHTNYNSELVQVYLSTEDSESIKSQRLCDSQFDCFLSIVPELVQDMVNRQVLEIPEESALQTNSFTRDSTSPSLVEFVEFNLVTATIKLSFSEIVNATSANITAITLQSFFELPQSRRTLISGTVTSSDSTELDFIIGEIDLLRIKAIGNICDSRAHCYITLSSFLILDFANNYNNPVTDGPPGIVVTRFISDTTLPSLQSYNLNLGVSIMTLFFDEPVLTSSLDPTGITFQIDALSQVQDQIQLTGGVSNSSATSAVIDFFLTRVDQNALKNSNIAKSRQTTYLILRGGTVTDTAINTNPVIAITNGSALQVTNYTADNNAPDIENLSTQS